LSKCEKADIKVLNYEQDVKEGTTQKMKFRWAPIEKIQLYFLNKSNLSKKYLNYNALINT